MSARPGPIHAAIAANRFGLGARPGELGTISDPRGWLLAQLEGNPPVLSGAGLKPAADTLARVIALRRDARDAREVPPLERDAPAAKAAAVKLPSLYRPIYIDEVAARVTHAVRTDRPFLERITQFWSNHFAVSIDKVVVLGLAGAMEREAIRPRVTGRFADLLSAVEKHPAMLLYLDNQASIGPGSRAARLAARRRGSRTVGINENLAREILELHTLGVGAGYSQADVTTFARALSGWTIGGQGLGGRRERPGFDAGTPGEFQFREAFHEPGTKELLGRKYGDDGLQQGEAILRGLASNPHTARHIATKLARHFIADDPPAAAVARIAAAWVDSDAHLPTVYRALVQSPEAWAEPLAKFKTPADYIHSSFRALDIPVRDERRLLQPFELLAQRHWMPGSPAGWPDTSADWDGSSALLKRIAWADVVAQRLAPMRSARELAPQLLGGSLSADTASALARAASGAQALTLLLASPEFMRR